MSAPVRRAKECGGVHRVRVDRHGVGQQLVERQGPRVLLHPGRVIRDPLKHLEVEVGLALQAQGFQGAREYRACLDGRLLELAQSR